MKIDVKIIDFPWARADSYVAPISTTESKKKVKVGYDDQATASKGGKSKRTKEVTVSLGEEGMESSLGFEAFGEYTWDEDAEALTPEVDLFDSNSRLLFWWQDREMTSDWAKQNPPFRLWLLLQLTAMAKLLPTPLSVMGLIQRLKYIGTHKRGLAILLLQAVMFPLCVWP